MARMLKKGWDDNRLVEEFNARHAAALEEIFLRLFKTRVYLAKNFVKLQDVAEDIVQNVLTDLFNDKGKQFRSLDEIEMYTYVRVSSRCIDYNRKLRHIRSKHEEMEYLHDPVESKNIEFQIIRAEIAQRLADEIGKLATRQRKVVELTRDGLSTEEIAQLLGITPRAVNSYRQTAFSILKDRLPDSAFLLLIILYTTETVSHSCLSIY